MKIKSGYGVMLVFIIMSMTACSLNSVMSPTPDLESTAKAMVEATASAQNNMQATIDAAVQQTAGAQTGDTTPTPAIQVNYYTLSEEELSALIDQSVEEALAASQTAYTETSQATSDGNVSSSEAETVVVTVAAAEELINEIDQMIYAYYDLYGAYASATLEVLQAIESDLMQINSDLQEINQMMQQGAEAATAAISELNTVVENLNNKAADIKEQKQGWADDVKNELDQREQLMLNLSPTEVTTDRLGALESVRKYASELKTSLSDRKISPDELQRIAQLGANADASIRQGGGSQLLDLSDQISSMTRLASRGDIPKVQAGLPDFERSVNRRR